MGKGSGLTGFEEEMCHYTKKAEVKDYEGGKTEFDRHEANGKH